MSSVDLTLQNKVTTPVPVNINNKERILHMHIQQTQSTCMYMNIEFAINYSYLE